MHRRREEHPDAQLSCCQADADYAALRLNTAIAKLIELNNYVTKVLVEDTIEYPIQINSKVRSRMVVPASAGPDEVRAAALAQVRVATLIDGEQPRKVIVVPGRLVNVVV